MRRVDLGALGQFKDNSWFPARVPEWMVLREGEADFGRVPSRPDDILLPSLVLTNPPISQMETIRPEEVQQFTQIPIMP